MRCNGCLYDGVCWAQIEETIEENETSECFEAANNFVKVVRCEDCIHWYEPEEVCLKIYSDGAVSQYAWQNRNPDDFCSYGERRGEDDG